MRIPKLTSPILLVIQCFLLISVHSAEQLDGIGTYDCDELVKLKQCWDNPTYMDEHCRKECWKWQLEQEKHDTFPIDEDNESFYDLSAKTMAGKTINFDQFEGLTTIVINTAIVCPQSPAEIEAFFEPFEMMRKFSPYTIDVVLFPFELSTADYSKQDCTFIKKAMKDPKHTIHVMDVIKINGPETHPVFKFLKKTADIDELQQETASFFVVSAEGNTLDVHRDSMVGSFIDHLKARMRQDFDRREF